MTLHLSNLDELLQKVRNPHPKNYLAEAIAAYRTGAYRAALVTTWIAVCVDILEKIRELSSANDGAAQNIEQRLNGINPEEPRQMMDFENDLLDIACTELELISTIEKAHLIRLKEDRNICAHPTFSRDGGQFSPLPETVLSYIVQSANYLLIHPPVKGRTEIDRLFELINEPSFPPDPENAFVVLRSSHNLGSVRDSVISNLTKVLLKRIFRDDEGISPSEMKRITSALHAIERLKYQQYEEVFENMLNRLMHASDDPKLKRAIPFFAHLPREWSRAEEAVKVRIDGLIQSMDAMQLAGYKTVEAAEQIQDINNILLQKFQNLTDQEKVSLISSSQSPIFKSHAIDLFTKSDSYDQAELRAKNLILPLTNHIMPSDLVSILNGACENNGEYGNNQILPARGIESFFLQLFAESFANFPENADAWANFRQMALNEGKRYRRLEAEMCSAGIIDIESEDQEEEPEWDEELPF